MARTGKGGEGSTSPKIKGVFPAQMEGMAFPHMSMAQKGNHAGCNPIPCLSWDPEPSLGAAEARRAVLLPRVCRLRVWIYWHGSATRRRRDAHAFLGVGLSHSQGSQRKTKQV